MEGGVAVDVVVHAHLHHILVPLGPQPVGARGVLLTVEVGRVVVVAGDILLPGVPQIGVGGVPAVHVLVVVVAEKLIALPAQLLGQGEVGVGAQLPGAAHGGRVAVLGVEPQQGLALPVGGAGEVQGGVVIVEHKALVGHLPQGGGELRVQGVAGEALQHEEDHVVPLKHAGVLVLVCGGDAVKVVGQPLDVPVGSALRHRLQVHVHHIGGGVHHRGGAGRRILVPLPRRVGGSGAGIHRQAGEVIVQQVARRYKLVLEVQPEHGHQPQLLHLVVQVGVHPVELLRGQIPAPGQVDRPQAQQVEDRRGRHQHAGKADVRAGKEEHPAAQDAHKQSGQQHQQDERDVGHHLFHDDRGIVRQVIARRHAQGTKGIEVLEDLLGDHLHNVDHRHQHRQHLGHHPVHTAPEGHGDGAEDAAHRQGKQDVDGRIGQGHVHGDVEDQLQIDKQEGEKRHPPHDPGKDGPV